MNDATNIFFSKTRLAFENLTARLKAGQSQGEANNNTGIELSQAAEVGFLLQQREGKLQLKNSLSLLQLHGVAFVTRTFLEEVTGAKALQRNKALNKVLENLLELFLLTNVLQYLNEILRVCGKNSLRISLNVLCLLFCRSSEFPMLSCVSCRTVWKMYSRLCVPMQWQFVMALIIMIRI